MKNKKLKKQALAFILSFALLPNNLLITALASSSDSLSAEETSISDESDTEETLLYVEQNTYSDYYDMYCNENRPDKEIIVNAANYVSAEDGDFEVGSFGGSEEIKDDVLIWNSPDGTVSYEINVEETGIYCMEMSYFAIEATTTTIELSMLIDGVSPYDTASRITLNKTWVNEKEITVDEKGNQVRPSQIQYGRWSVTDVKDIDGLFNDPLIFYLEKGTHTITFTSSRANIALEYFKFHQPDSLPSYEEIAPSQSEIDSTPSYIQRVEGENAVYKSDSTLYPTYDRKSYLCSPSDPVKMTYNTIGNANWKKALQTITWEIDVENDGYYKLGIKSRQQEMRGFYSNRRIYIDDVVPCEELDQVKFYYNTDWTVVTPTDNDGNDIYIYLTAGTHTITMEAIPGEIGDAMRKLDDIVLDINNYYRQIIMITGPSPDKYTDYYVHEKIPDIVSEFERISKELEEVQKSIETLSNSEGSEAAVLEKMRIVLDSCVEKPLKIPDYLSQIKDNVTSISSWMRDYRDQPLEIDYIEIASANQQFASTDEKFFKSLAFSAKSFFSSFSSDYSMLSDDTGEDTLTVWVNLGRDQAQVVKELVESEFTPETGINVSVNLVQGTVVEASLANKGPDIALFLGGEFPVNLAVRGLLVNLSEYSDYDEVKSRFQENATVQYEYDGSCYGIPLSQTYPMLFYRKDVLSELGFNKAPETWTELIDMLPALQRNYLSVGLILPAANVQAATEAGHTFATLLLQNGISYYNPEQTSTTFDEIEAVQAFTQWTDFYTKYNFEQTYDAFNRFRTGEYPMVIQNYSFYNQLTVASPEISGLWDFTSVPGTAHMDEDGNVTVSHATNSSGTAAVIFEKVKNKDNAWEFVKWFSSTEVQVEYATAIEGLLGTMGRYETANLEALTQLSWSQSEIDKLVAQRDELAEIPVIASSYAVSRNIMNAFRDVVNDNENSRDTLMWYNRDINAEITRKRENLGLDG